MKNNVIKGDFTIIEDDESFELKKATGTNGGVYTDGNGNYWSYSSDRVSDRGVLLRHLRKIEPTTI